MTSSRGEYTFPSQMDWDANLRGLNSSGSSVQCLIIMIYVYMIRKLLRKHMSRFSKSEIIAKSYKAVEKLFVGHERFCRNSM